MRKSFLSSINRLEKSLKKIKKTIENHITQNNDNRTINIGDMFVVEVYGIRYYLIVIQVAYKTYFVDIVSGYLITFRGIKKYPDEITIQEVKQHLRGDIPANAKIKYVPKNEYEVNINFK